MFFYQVHNSTSNEKISHLVLICILLTTLSALKSVKSRTKSFKQVNSNTKNNLDKKYKL